jgi:ferrochelatase
MTERAREAIQEIPAERRDAAALLYTAHSIPASMAASSRYESQLRETCQLVSRGLAREPWQLVYQSRSGPPTQPWLEPDISDALRALKKDGASDAVVVPIGFISDHMEVVYDLDTEAQHVCDEIGLNMVRARTVGTHPAFVSMIRELIAERAQGAPPRWLGDHGPSQDVCPVDCCVKR